MLSPKVLIDNGRSRLWVVENFSPDFYPQLQQVPLHEEPPIFFMGSWKKQRRDIGFFSDESRGYKYSGTFMPSSPLSTAPVVQHLLVETNKLLGTTFNGVLINRYRNGEKVIGAHSDDEVSLDKTRKMVAAIAYGPGIRTFRIRDKQSKKIVLDYQHLPCSLLVMEQEFQKDFTHEIPQQKRVKEERISVTFRHHLE